MAFDASRCTTLACTCIGGLMPSPVSVSSKTSSGRNPRSVSTTMAPRPTVCCHASRAARALGQRTEPSAVRTGKSHMAEGIVVDM